MSLTCMVYGSGVNTSVEPCMMLGTTHGTPAISWDGIVYGRAQTDCQVYFLILLHEHYSRLCNFTIFICIIVCHRQTHTFISTYSFISTSLNALLQMIEYHSENIIGGWWRLLAGPPDFTIHQREHQEFCEGVRILLNTN